MPGGSVTFPHVLGNDIAGEIDELPAPVDGLAVGQRVMLSPGTSSRRCAMCLAGEDHSSRQDLMPATPRRHAAILAYQVPGGYAERVCAPASNVTPTPDAIAFEHAAAFPLVFL